MKEAIAKILKDILGADAPAELSVPDDEQFGHYSTNLAMRIAKARGEKPLELAQELAVQIKEKAPAGFFEKVEAAAPGFINLWISKAALRKELARITREKYFGRNETLKGKTVMVEYTDPNPFKLFHIGHLMSNAIGESFARLFEAAGAKVVRANYQGDVGLHVAKAVWAMEELAGKEHTQKMPGESVGTEAKMEFLGKAYAYGSLHYEEAKEAINGINEKIYSRADAHVNELYDKGRRWSLEYFETIYERLGTKFDQYFFEGEIGKEGVELVRERKDVFVESEGAIVFPGEKYGLHTRVFINSRGLPTYEAKELGLNKKKFELYPLDLSVIVTGNEIIDYFKVLLKAMELALPEIAKKTKHVPHGMLRLPTGKMSSRTGDVITAAALLDTIKEKLREVAKGKTELPADEREAVTEAIAVGAIKYSILKQNPGQDIIFDFDTSISFAGDAGPYLQYTYARLTSIMRKAGEASGGTSDSKNIGADGLELLDTDVECALIRKIAEFPDAVMRAGASYLPSTLATYLHKLAVVANKLYETTPILKDENAARVGARLLLVGTAANTLRAGLALLGIEALEKI